MDAPLGEAAYPEVFNFRPSHFRISVFDILAEAIPNRSQLTKPEQSDLIDTALSNFKETASNISLSGRLSDHSHLSQNLIRLVYLIIRGDELIIQQEPCFRLSPREASRYFSILQTVVSLERAVLISSSLDKGYFSESVHFIDPLSGESIAGELSDGACPGASEEEEKPVDADQTNFSPGINLQELPAAQAILEDRFIDNPFEGLIWCSKDDNFGLVGGLEKEVEPRNGVRNIVFVHSNLELMSLAKERDTDTHELNLHPKIAPTVDAYFKICQKLESLIKQYGVVHIYANREGLLGQLLTATYHIFLGYGLHETMELVQKAYPRLASHEDYSEFSSYLSAFSSF